MQIKPDMLLMLMWQDAVDWLGAGVGAGRKRLMQVRNLEGDPCSCISFQREGCAGKQLSVTAPGALSQLSRTVVFINISGIRELGDSVSYPVIGKLGLRSGAVPEV